MTDYQWAIETLADCADGVDANNLRELIGELRGDPIYIMEQVVKKMEAELERRIEDDSLCPNCLTGLQTAMKVHHSNNRDEPPGTWEEPAGEYCPECDYEGGTMMAGFALHDKSCPECGSENTVHATTKGGTIRVDTNLILQKKNGNAGPALCEACTNKEINSEMYEACKAALAVTGGSEHWNGETHRFLKAIEAALAKAEGRERAREGF